MAEPDRKDDNQSVLKFKPKDKRNATGGGEVLRYGCVNTCEMRCKMTPDTPQSTFLFPRNLGRLGLGGEWVSTQVRLISKK